MGGCDRDPAGRGVSSSSRRRGWGCGRRAAVSSGDKKPEGGGGGGPAASAQRCSLSVAARCSTSNPLARITWPRGAGQRLLSPRARGCCGREWWPVCAGAPRPTPKPPPGQLERRRGIPHTQSTSLRLCPPSLPACPRLPLLCRMHRGKLDRKEGELWTNMCRRGVSDSCLSFTSISLVLLLSSPLARACHPDKEMQVVSL